MMITICFHVIADYINEILYYNYEGLLVNFITIIFLNCKQI